MENDWDLQALPIASRTPLPGMFPRIGSNGILSTSVESLSPLKVSFPPAAKPRYPSENFDPARKMSCCPDCMQSYEQELAKLVAKELDKSSQVKADEVRTSLPQWLQNAKSHDNDLKAMNQAEKKDSEMILKQKTQELQKKWKETCMRSHPSFHQHIFSSERIVPTPLTMTMTGLHHPNQLGRQPFPPKPQLNRNLAESLPPNRTLLSGHAIEQTGTPPGSPVRTDLALGRTKPLGTSPRSIGHKELTKDLLSCMPSEQNKNPKLERISDADSFKRLLKGLAEKVWWQQEAASAVAARVTHCKTGNGNRRGEISKGDIWLLFTGPDRVGKKKMAAALAELVNGGNPTVISLGTRRGDGEPYMNCRGKTVLDRMVEAVRRNPFSVIMLENIDEADMVVCGSMKRAMERGRLADSHGREISLGNVIFILTTNCQPDNLNNSSTECSFEEKFTSVAHSSWRLRLSLSEKTSKRRATWLDEEERSPTKPRKGISSGLSFDLNEAAYGEDDGGDGSGSRNSSDLTVEHEVEQGLDNRRSPITSPASSELAGFVDDAIFFKPVDLAPIRRDIASSIAKKFSSVIGDKISIEVQDDAVERLLAGAWLGRTGVEEWTEKVLVPSFHQLKSQLPTSDGWSCNEIMVARLETDGDSGSGGGGYGEWLPGTVEIVINGS